MATYDLRVIPFGGGAVVEDFASGGRRAASIERISWVLNQPGSMSFRAPLDHPATLATNLLRCEVAVYRNDVLIWRGIPLQRERSGAAAMFTCAGLLWPFTRWHVGPNTGDFLNGMLRFGSGLTGWTVNCDLAEVTSTIVREGSTAALLTHGSADADAYIEATIVQADTGPDGEYIEVAAEYLIDPSQPWLGPAFEERGLYVESPVSLPDGTPTWEPITNSSPRGVWQRVKVGIHLAPNEINAPVHVRLYAPGGRIAWDNGAAKNLVSVGANQIVGEDAVTVFQRLATYGQDTKTDLGLALAGAASGVNIRDVYQASELPNLFEIMESYPARGLLDFAVIDRTLHTWSPRRGTYKPAQALVVRPDDLSADVRVLAYGHRADGSQAATQVVRTGAGEGATRDVHFSTDTSQTDGLVLEHVGAVPSHYTPDDLSAAVGIDLAALRGVDSMPSAQVPAEGWLGVLEEGDTTDVLFDDGAVQETTIRRVLAVHLDPRTDTLAYDLADQAEPA